MTLSRKHRDQLLAGHHPQLRFPEAEAPPVGARITLERHRFWIEVLRHKPDKGEVIAEYLVRDDRPRFMAKNSGYTHSPSRKMGASDRAARGNLVEEDEAPDHQWVAQDRIRREVDIRDAWRQSQRRIQDAVIREERKLRNARARGKDKQAERAEAQVISLRAKLRDAA